MSACDAIREALRRSETFEARSASEALAALAEVEAERDTRTRQLALVKETLTTRTTTLRERAEKAEAMVARQGEALRAIAEYVPSNRRADSPREIARAALAGSDEPPAGETT